jgi:hypothetical protein
MHVLPKGMVVFFKEMFVFHKKNGCVLFRETLMFSKEMIVFHREMFCGPHGSKFLCFPRENGYVPWGMLVLFIKKCLPKKQMY